MLTPKPAVNKQLLGIERLEQQAVVRVGVHLRQNGLDSPFRSNTATFSKFIQPSLLPHSFDNRARDHVPADFR